MSLFSYRNVCWLAAMVLIIAGCKESTISSTSSSDTSDVSGTDDSNVDLPSLQTETAVEEEAPPSSTNVPLDESPVVVDKDAPQYALVTFLVAMMSQDEKALREVTVPTEDFDWLLKGNKAPEATIERLKNELYPTIQPMRPGDELTLLDGQKFVAKPEDVTDERALLLIPGAPEPISCVKIEGRWRVDAEGLIKARKFVAQEREKEEKKPQ